MRTPLFWVKITNFEYWSWWVFYFLLIPYWLYLSFRTRSFTFFTAVNPSIENGGFYGERKIEILKLISPKYLPKMCFVEYGTSLNKVVNLLIINNIQYPIIAKPTIGERGNNVSKILDKTQLTSYHQTIKEAYIIQEFIPFEIELGILYSRLPDETKGKISSIVLKEFLAVKGDGIATIEELILKNNRARFQLKNLRKEMLDGIYEVLPLGEKRILEPIGNHCRGTKFINANFLINKQLEEVFDEISENIQGFYYGRFDLKVTTYEDLFQGKNIKIMELNGVSSDPGHIYDPTYKIWNAYQDLMWHWQRTATICIQNQRRNIKPTPFIEVLKLLKNHFIKP